MRRISLGFVGAAMIGAAGFCGLTLHACAPSPLPETVRVGPRPSLPAPRPQLIPTINIAHAVGWPDKSAGPKAPAGFAVTRFADGLDHPRWLYRLPNGDVLVAEATTPTPKVEGVSSLVAKYLQEDAGALGSSPDRVVLLRDLDGDGIADERHTFLDHLNRPFGMLLLGDTFYVANTDAVLAFPYRQGETRIAAKSRVIAKLPDAPSADGHWTRNLIASEDGTRILIAVGSSSNIADNGMDAEKRRADILEINPDGTGERIFASGLRNPNGLAWEPRTHKLWTVVNERDMLGDDLAPDYLTHVEEGGFYGWPYSYWGGHADPRIAEKDRRPDLVARAIVPDYSLGAHVAALGLAFYTADAFPARYHGGAFVGLHGSWNRSDPVGYAVVFVPFANGQPAGPPQDFLTGFLDADGQAQGRPVGVVLDSAGALLVADDVGNVIWRVAATPRQQ